MGFLGPIPADQDKLRATWDHIERVLTLYAGGTAQKFTAGIHFTQGVSPEPLLPVFRLMGWVGPLAKGGQPYSYHQQISHAQVWSVKIITSNFSKGVVVRVEQLNITHGPVIDPPGGSDKQDITDVPVVEPAQVAGANVTAFFRKPFQIQYSAHTDPMGSVTISAPTEFLTLQSASIFNGNIIWTFLPIKIGDCDATVHVSHGFKPLETGQTFNIRIFPILAPPPTPQPINGSNVSQGPPLGPGPVVIYPFETRVETAIDIVKGKYPDAVLYNVTNFTEDPAGAGFIEQLNQMVVTFRGGFGSIKIESPGWNVWGPPEEGPIIVGNADVKWPVPIPAEKAFKQAQEWRGDQNVKSINLFAPSGPFPFSSIYGVTLVDGQHVIVPGSAPDSKN